MTVKERLEYIQVRSVLANRMVGENFFRFIYRMYFKTMILRIKWKIEWKLEEIRLDASVKNKLEILNEYISELKEDYLHYVELKDYDKSDKIRELIKIYEKDSVFWFKPNYIQEKILSDLLIEIENYNKIND